MVPNAIGVGELIGKPCVSSDGVEIGRVVFLERDADGSPRWFDVELREDREGGHGVRNERVRLSASRLAAWEEDRVVLDCPRDEIGSQWFPVQPETYDVPDLDL